MNPFKTRHFWVISGPIDWCCSITEQWFPSGDDVCYVNANTLPLSLLGSECSVLVLNAFFKFNIDSFGLLAGTVVGGGHLVLMTPPFEFWPYYPDQENSRLLDQPILPHASRFIKKIMALLQQDASVHHVTPESLPNFKPPLIQPIMTLPQSASESNWLTGAITADQHQAIEAIYNLLMNPVPNHLLLTACRGRGKTAALGLAAAKILKMTTRDKPISVIVTAPCIKALKSFYVNLFNGLSLAIDQTRIAISVNGHQLLFLPPDQVCCTTADLLLVDEAAAIPIPMLNRMSEHFPRVVFSSTLDGYEGTGKGFSLRFKALGLKKGWVVCELDQPIRWSMEDPVEKLVFRLLSLHPIANTPQSIRLDALTVKKIQQSDLLNNPFLLEQVFALLTSAHYQTKPSYLRQLMDADNVLIYILESTENVVIGVLVGLIEGPVPAHQEDIILGKRRLKNHFLPQLLTTQCHVDLSLKARALRIQRLVIHPVFQNKGLGHFLVQSVISTCHEYDIDYVGCTFGMTQALLRFWKRQSFQLVGVGVKLETNTGCHAATFIYSVSKQGATIKKQASHAFYHQIQQACRDYLNQLDGVLTEQILKSMDAVYPEKLTEEELAIVTIYVNGYRLFEYVHSVLFKLFWCKIRQALSLNQLSSLEKKMLILKIAHNKNWSSCVTLLSLSGKNEAIKLLRLSVKQLLR